MSTIKRPLNVQTPGDDRVSDAVPDPDNAVAPTAHPTPDLTPPGPGSAAKPEHVSHTGNPKQQVPTKDLPDQSDVDPEKIPYGQTQMSKQGAVCSTQPDPKRK